MLRLASNEPAWVEIVPASDAGPAVRVQFAPIGPLTWRRSLAKVRAALGDVDGDVLAAGDALSRELLRGAILAWENVGDADGNPLPVTPATIELFLGDIAAFEAADRAFVIPWVNRDQEKNGSSGSPSGTSGAATPDNATATSPVTGDGTGDAAPGKKARAARTPRTPRKPRPARASGPSSKASAAKPALP